MGLSRTRHITTASTSGRSAAISGRRGASRRTGGGGSRISALAVGGCRRGRRFTARWPSPSGWAAAGTPEEGRNRSVDEPSLSRACRGSSRGVPSTRTPSSQVPLVDRRSRTRTPPALTSSSACTRERPGSSILMLASAARPTRCRPGVKAQDGAGVGAADDVDLDQPARAAGGGGGVRCEREDDALDQGWHADGRGGRQGPAVGIQRLQVLDRCAPAPVRRRGPGRSRSTPVARAPSAPRAPWRR